MHIGVTSCISPATAALLKSCLPLILLTLLLAWRANAVADWIRAAWILRKLDRPSGNVVYGGVRRLLTGKRLRVMQAVNESVVGGSGVFYYNILWGHVRCTPCLEFWHACICFPRSRAAPVSGTCCLPADGGSFRASNCCRTTSQYQSCKAYSACDGALSSGQLDYRFAASISEDDKVCNEG